MVKDKLNRFSDEEIELGKNISYALWGDSINCHGISVKESLSDLLAFRRGNYLGLAIEHIKTATESHEAGCSKSLGHAIIRAIKSLEKHRKLHDIFVLRENNENE